MQGQCVAWNPTRTGADWPTSSRVEVVGRDTGVASGTGRELRFHDRRPKIAPMTPDDIAWRFQESGEIKLQFARTHADRMVTVADLLSGAVRSGRKILLFGNGGSATDASHIAAEFVGRYERDRMPLPALSLHADGAAMTCIANDYGYADVFARQIDALGCPGDIAIAISTSGRSPNVLKGVEAARRKGLVTVGWTGKDGGPLATLVDHLFIVPSHVTARIQECHITLGHVLCEMVEETLVAHAS